ncbi:MAG TPA: VWA domain-containing protein [Pyrinomonadaceae bacterium]|nr:VWA domain-containing protein [Pyrinomonadaceae bacterium]
MNNNETKKNAASELARALAAFACAVCLLAVAAPSPRAQSGRRGAPPPAQTRDGRPATTPTPAFAPPTGPIAEPPTPERQADKYPLPSQTNDAATVQSASHGAAKSPTKTDADEGGDDEVVRISSNLVPVPASVVDARGRAVTDLNVEDFELRVDGAVRPVGELSRSETPVSIALLFDNSSSLNATRSFERQAGIRFLKSVVRPVDRAAVYSIETTPVLAHTLTNDVHALVRTIEDFGKPIAATALFDTVATAADYLKPQKTRKVIVIVSDGTDTISDLDFDATMARLLADDCQVYAVETGNSDNANLHDLAGQRRLEEFTGQTGGAVFVPHTNAELSEAFEQIAADLAHQYILSYYPPTADPRDGRFRTVTLTVKTRQGLRVRTRKGYYAPKS